MSPFRLATSWCLTCLTLAFVLGGLPSNVARAQTSDTPDPEMVLRGLAEHLGRLDAYACQIDSVMEIKAQGMENRMTSTSVFRLQRPNRVALISTEGIGGMTIVSDGETVVRYFKALERYTRGPAPETIDELMLDPTTMAANSSGSPGGMMIPFGGEAFYDHLMDGVTATEYVRAETVRGQQAHRCRFTQEQFTWDAWVATGDKPLLLKVSIELSDQLRNANPMLKDATFNASVEFTDWDLAPQFDDDAFRYEPPASAEQVEDLFENMLEGLAGDDDQGPHPLLGEPAPTFKSQNLDGKPFDLAGLVGDEQIVILDFWATWCPPCIEALPRVASVAEQFQNRGVKFFAVNVGEEVDQVREFLTDQELELPVLMDRDGAISDLYGANAIPQTVLIGKGGVVEVVHVGMSGNLEEQLADELRRLLEGEKLAEETLKRAEQAAVEETVGARRVWTVTGRWHGLTTNLRGDAVYAISNAGERVVISPDGESEMLSKLAVGGRVRAANLSGGDRPDWVTFDAWGETVEAYSADGEKLWGHSGGQGIDDVWPADLDGDGKDEVIIGYNGSTGLHVLSPDGEPRWKHTEIGNVWHVTAGDVDGDGNVEVVSTSAGGVVHLFDADGKNRTDRQLSIYASMVRILPAAEPGAAQPILVAGTANSGEQLLRIDAEGNVSLSVDLPTGSTAHVDDVAVSRDRPWAAVAMRGGMVHVVDLERGEIVATVAGQSEAPSVAWCSRNNLEPLLTVTGKAGVEAYEIGPDPDEANRADQPEKPTDDR